MGKINRQFYFIAASFVKTISCTSVCARKAGAECPPVHMGDYFCCCFLLGLSEPTLQLTRAQLHNIYPSFFPFSECYSNIFSYVFHFGHDVLLWSFKSPSLLKYFIGLFPPIPLPTIALYSASSCTSHC